MIRLLSEVAFEIAFNWRVLCLLKNDLVCLILAMRINSPSSNFSSFPAFSSSCKTFSSSWNALQAKFEVMTTKILKKGIYRMFTSYSTVGMFALASASKAVSETLQIVSLTSATILSTWKLLKLSVVPGRSKDVAYKNFWESKESLEAIWRKKTKLSWAIFIDIVFISYQMFVERLWSTQISS